MAGGSSTQQLIGSLLVRITGDAKKLYDEGKKAETSLKGVDTQTKKTDVTLVNLGRTLVKTAATVATAFAAMTARSIFMASSMGTLGEKIGFPVERLSALKFAAEQTGAEFDKLRIGLLELGKKAQEASVNAFSPAAAAFSDMGIAVTDANGRIRDTSELLDLVADRFSNYRDGVNKTTLAMKLFGAEAGPALIPLLNKGKVGMAELEAEAKRLGVTLNTETVKAATEFTNELNKLKARVEGVANSLVAVLLPALQNINRELERRSGQDWARYLVTSVLGVTNSLGGLVKITDPTLSALIEQEKQFQANGAAVNNATQALTGYSSAFANYVNNTSKEEAPTATPLTDLTEAALSAARESARAGMEEILAAPTETATAKLAALEEALKSGTISWREFGGAVRAVNDENQQNLDDLLSATSQTITAMFSQSKTAAIASALINTYQGITKALSAYPPPFAQAMAALTAAQGFAQVAAIKSTSKTSTGGARSAPAAPAAPAEAGGNVNTLNVRGIGPEQLFTGSAVEALAGKLLGYQRDGGKVVFQS